LDCGALTPLSFSFLCFLFQSGCGMVRFNHPVDYGRASLPQEKRNKEKKDREKQKKESGVKAPQSKKNLWY
jgi:hypothetical protein